MFKKKKSVRETIKSSGKKRHKMYLKRGGLSVSKEGGGIVGYIGRPKGKKDEAKGKKRS